MVGRQEKNEVRDPPPACLAVALVLYCQHTQVLGSEWEEEKEKKASWKFPTTLLLHFLWSEPSCVRSLYSWRQYGNKCQASISREEGGMDTSCPLAGFATRLLKHLRDWGGQSQLCLLSSPSIRCLGFGLLWLTWPLPWAEYRAGDHVPSLTGRW